MQPTETEIPYYTTYYQANKERCLRIQYKWKLKNAKYYKEYQEKYRKDPANRAKNIEYQKVYYAKNKEYQRDYYLKRKLAAQQQKAENETK
jgi:hypothetical protein